MNIEEYRRLQKENEELKEDNEILGILLEDLVDWDDVMANTVPFEVVKRKLARRDLNKLIAILSGFAALAIPVFLLYQFHDVEWAMSALYGTLIGIAGMFTYEKVLEVLGDWNG